MTLSDGGSLIFRPVESGRRSGDAVEVCAMSKITVKEAAGRAGVTRQAIESAIKKGTLFAEKEHGTDVLIEEAAFEAWMVGRAGKGVKRGPKPKGEEL